MNVRFYEPEFLKPRRDFKINSLQLWPLLTRGTRNGWKQKQSVHAERESQSRVLMACGMFSMDPHNEFPEKAGKCPEGRVREILSLLPAM